MHERTIAAGGFGTRRPVLVVALAVIGCAGTTPVATTAPARPGDAAPMAGATANGLVPGSLAVSWMHGSADCSQDTDPEVQVHRYNATTFIIRQNKCKTFEAPFVYLLVGTQSALSFDTGATDTPTLRDTITGLIGSRP